MKMKNAEVDSLANFLMGLELKGRDSRLRTRFVKVLAERQRLISEEHQELLKQYGNLDEEGNIKIIERDGKRLYDVNDKITFNREYFLLLNEDFIIDETEERREMLTLIKNIILNCDKTFMGEEALEYDRWCDIAEQISFDAESLED